MVAGDHAPCVAERAVKEAHADGAASGFWDTGGGVESDQRVCVRDTLSVLRRWRGRSVCVDTLIDHVRGMAISEIAEQRGLPSSTVRRRIHEARKLLKKLVNVN